MFPVVSILFKLLHVVVTHLHNFVKNASVNYCLSRFRCCPKCQPHNHLDQFSHGSWVAMSSFICCLFRRNLFRSVNFYRVLSRRQAPTCLRISLEFVEFRCNFSMRPYMPVASTMNCSNLLRVAQGKLQKNKLRSKKIFLIWKYGFVAYMLF